MKLSIERTIWTIMWTAAVPSVFILMGLTFSLGGPPAYEDDANKISILGMWVLMPFISWFAYNAYEPGVYSRVAQTFVPRLRFGLFWALMGAFVVVYGLIGLTLLSTSVGDRWLGLSVGITLFAAITMGAVGFTVWAPERPTSK